MALVADVTEEKVKSVVWRCDKSPGVDGFNFNFIKFCWKCLKEDFLATVNDFVERGNWLRESNASFLCLIPKFERICNNLASFDPFCWKGVCIRLYKKIFPSD